MKGERTVKSRDNSANQSFTSGSSSQYFNFLDRSHSVFGRNPYYNDLLHIHPWLRRPRSRHSGIPLPAIAGTRCSPHYDELSRPKIRRENHIRQEFFDNFRNYSYSGVTPAALTANCSEPLAALAHPKGTSTGNRKSSKAPKQASENDAHAQPSNRANAPAKPRQK